MAEFFSNAFSYVLIFFVLVCWILVTIRFSKAAHSPIKTVKAKVVDKYKSEPASRHPGVSGNERFVVVFAAGDKKLAFNVSEYSFQSYKINEKGTLKYKGNRIIDFR